MFHEQSIDILLTIMMPYVLRNYGMWSTRMDNTVKLKVEPEHFGRSPGVHINPVPTVLLCPHDHVMDIHTICMSGNGDEYVFNTHYVS